MLPQHTNRWSLPSRLHTPPLPPTTHLRFTPRCVSFPSPATASFITFKGCVSGDQTILIPPAPTTINHPGSGPLQTDLILLEPIPHALNRSPLRARFTQCGGCHARCLCSDHPWLSPAALSSGGAHARTSPFSSVHESLCEQSHACQCSSQTFSASNQAVRHTHWMSSRPNFGAPKSELPFGTQDVLQLPAHPSRHADASSYGSHE